MVEYMRTGRPYLPADELLLQSWLSGWAIPDLATGAELIGWSLACGFDAVDLLDITPQVRPSLRRLYRLAQVTWPLALLGRGMEVRSQAQHGNVRGARDQYRALRRGLWFEGILTATAD